MRYNALQWPAPLSCVCGLHAACMWAMQVVERFSELRLAALAHEIQRLTELLSGASSEL